MKHEPLESTARSWVVRLVSGDVDEETLAAFKTWQAARPEHAAAFDRARHVYATAAQYRADLRPDRRRPILWPGLALAASLAVGILVTRPDFIFTPDYVTPDGPAREFALADGSRLILDGGSALDVHMDDGARALTLRRGRAYFRVKHEKARSFTVAFKDGVVTDIGTAFTVSERADGGEVHVTQGIVRVDAHGSDRTLQAGQAARWSRADLNGIASTAAALAWKDGNVVIRDQSLADAAQALDPYVPGRIMVMGDVARAKVGGTFKTTQAAAGLAALARSQGARLRKIAGITIISRW